MVLQEETAQKATHEERKRETEREREREGGREGGREGERERGRERERERERGIEKERERETLHPSWTGLGWKLKAGEEFRRKRNLRPYHAVSPLELWVRV